MYLGIFQSIRDVFVGSIQVQAGMIITYNYRVCLGGGILCRLRMRFLYRWIDTSRAHQFDAIKVFWGKYPCHLQITLFSFW